MKSLKKIEILKDSISIHKKLSAIKSNASKSMICFYNSHINSIITDPVYMSIPLEDKLIHRAYSVFDTSKIYGNKIFNVDQHINRFFDSIEIVELKNKFTKEEVKDIILYTASAARSLEKDSDIDIRFYYSAGLGSFFLNEFQDKHSFYVLAYRANNSIRPMNGTIDYTICKTQIENKIKHAKKTDYLINCIVNKRITEKNGYLGLLVDDEGNFLETPISCLGFIIEEDKNLILNIPSFEKTLAGSTAIKCIEYTESTLLQQGVVTSISRKDLNIKDISKIREAMYLGGDFAIPILKINDIEITKEPGIVTLLFQTYLKKDKAEGNYDIINSLSDLELL